MRQFRCVALAACASLLVISSASEAKDRPSAAFPLRTSTQLNASAGVGVINQTNTAPYVAQVGSLGSGGLVVGYDKVSDSYSVRDVTSGDATSGLRSPVRSGVYDVYTKKTRTVVDELKLYNAARATTSAIPLTYLNFGIWTRTDNTAVTKRQYGLVYGFLTPPSGIPRTGSASYRTLVNGSSTIIGTNAGTRQVGGTATFDADFASSTISTQLNLAYVVNGSQSAIGVFQGSSAITSGQFTGPLASNAPFYVGGSFAGAFYGPTAQEMGYSFGIMRHNYDPYAGATPNFLDEAIVGTVVGTRR